MSMLSVQIDELRNAARGQKAMGLFELAQMLNDAADTICELRGALQVASVDYRHLADENTKLRELCEVLAEFLTEAEWLQWPELRAEMQRLGLEVSE